MESGAMCVSFVAALPSGDTVRFWSTNRNIEEKDKFKDVLLMMVSPASVTQHSLFPVYLLS